MRTKLTDIGLVVIAIFFISTLNAQPLQIVLSSRAFHPTNSADTLNTLKAIDEFKPDRIDWMYCEDAAKLDLLKQRGIKYSLTIHPQLEDSAGYTTKKGRIVDIYGKPVVAPWQRGWKIKDPYWGCVNNPYFEALFTKKTEKLVDLGAYGIVVDDARFNDQADEWGGCFCDYCVRGFNTYLRDNNIDVPPYFNYKNTLLTGNNNSGVDLNRLKQLYKSYQTQSVVNFLKKWRETVSSYAGRPVVFITNNYLGRWNDIYKVFDVGIAEMPEGKAVYKEVDDAISNAKKYGKRQIFSYATADDAENIAFYLYCYLKGAESIIPWDTYMNESSKTAPARHFIPSGLILPEINFLEAEGSKLADAKSINPSSFGITSDPGNICICKKLADGSVYLFATHDFNEPGRNIYVTIASPKTLAEPLTKAESGKFFKISTSGLNRTAVGEFVLLKLK